MARVPRSFSGIWHRITGTYQKVRDRNERETARCIARDSDEKQAMIARQLHERGEIQEKVQALKREHREAMLNIRLDIGRYMEMQGHTKAPDLTDRASTAPATGKTAPGRILGRRCEPVGYQLNSNLWGGKLPSGNKGSRLSDLLQ